MKIAVLSLLLVCGAAGFAAAGDSTFEVYGHVMLDAGYNFKQIAPDWYDVMRPTKLPVVNKEFGSDGNTYWSVRQTRFGVRTSTPTELGNLTTLFEWELFGTGVDAGQTTLRLRHAYGQLGKFGAGQTWSPFMDIDVFPNTLEYWGPCGMVFFRNIQLRFMPIQGDTRFTIALERPGASGDGGAYADRVELQDIQPRFPVPDLSAEYRMGREWGYVELAGILRRIQWDDAGTDSVDVSGNVTGWGLNLTSNIKMGGNDTARLEVVYGEGIENYMNDAPEDVAIDKVNPSSTAPISAKALPVTGVVAFLDHTWNERYSTSLGYSMVNIDNTGAQLPAAFHRGQYAIVNLLYYPVPNVTCGIEAQYGKRENFKEDPAAGNFKESDDFKIQVSFKYNFSQSM
ncbi:MAG TPA: DcaP family trimeric outer membrane transporter [Candidatus Krumholzibacteria bacterium]|nr:DcaP family trimeric outer membrane transporter [Candidatus Krumholzibacteria bacterium]